MQAEQQSERERFEAWFERDYMSGLDGPGEWDAERNCYVQLPVHMAWCAYRAALSHPSTPQGWQDIESAPKDGRTLLLGYFNSHGKWRTLRGQWMSQDYIDEYWEEPEGVEAWWFETVVECDEIPNCWPAEPTHWMPLPPPPEQGGKG